MQPSQLRTLKGFKCLHLNCCSIVKKIDLIRYTLIDETKCDYYCFTESWLKPNIDSSLFEIDDYSLIRCDRSLPSRSGAFFHGGEIICYVCSRLTPEVFDRPYISFHLEIIVIIINRQDQRRLYIINIYRPPSGNVETAINLITDMVKKIHLDTSRHSIIMMGDFNIDYSLNKDQNRYTTLLKNFSTNLPQLINQPTRFGPVSSSIIDLMCSDSKAVSYHGTISFYVSDHIPTFLVIKKHKQQYNKTKFTGRSYLNYNKIGYMNF